MNEGLRSGKLRFVVGAAAAVPSAEFVYLCVPTPQRADGAADLSYIEAAATEISAALEPDCVVVNKSTVPVGSTKVVERALGRAESTWCRTPSSSGRARPSTTSCTPIAS